MYSDFQLLLVHSGRGPWYRAEAQNKSQPDKRIPYSSTYLSWLKSEKGKRSPLRQTRGQWKWTQGRSLATTFFEKSIKYKTPREKVRGHVFKKMKEKILFKKKDFQKINMIQLRQLKTKGKATQPINCRALTFTRAFSERWSEWTPDCLIRPGTEKWELESPLGGYLKIKEKRVTQNKHLGYWTSWTLRKVKITAIEKGPDSLDLRNSYTVENKKGISYLSQEYIQ